MDSNFFMQGYLCLVWMQYVHLKIALQKCILLKKDAVHYFQKIHLKWQYHNNICGKPPTHAPPLALSNGENNFFYFWWNFFYSLNIWSTGMYHTCNYLKSTVILGVLHDLHTMTQSKTSFYIIDFFLVFDQFNI